MRAPNGDGTRHPRLGAASENFRDSGDLAFKYD